jgi:WD40 repeat protein
MEVQKLEYVCMTEIGEEVHEDDEPPNNCLESGNSNEISHEFFLYLKLLPHDIKRYIILLVMGDSCFNCFEYSQTLQTDYSLAAPVIFNPNCKTILVTSYPKNIFGLSITNNTDAQLFDIISGNLLYKHKGSNKIICMSVGNEIIIIVTSSGEITIMDTNTGRIITEYKLDLYPKAISSDGSRIVMNDDANYLGDYFLVDIGLDKLIENLNLVKDLKFYQLEITQKKLGIDIFTDKLYYPKIHFSSDDSLIIFNAVVSIVLHGKTGEVIKSIDDNLEIVTVSNDNNRIGGYRLGNIEIYDREFKELIRIVCDRCILSLAFSPDNSVIIGSSNSANKNEGSLFFHVWNVLTGQLIYSKRGFFAPNFSLNSDFIFSKSQDKDMIRFWQAYTGNHIKTLKFDAKIKRICPSNYNDIIFVGLKDKSHILSCRNMNQRNVFNRIYNMDPTWELFMKLYPLFYIEEKDEEEVLIDLQLEEYSLDDNGDVFINFSNFFDLVKEDTTELINEDMNDIVQEKSCFQDIGYFILYFFGFSFFVGIVFIGVVLFSPLIFIYFVVSAFNICEIRADN